MCESCRHKAGVEAVQAAGFVSIAAVHHPYIVVP